MPYNDMDIRTFNFQLIWQPHTTNSCEIHITLVVLHEHTIFNETNYTSCNKHHILKSFVKHVQTVFNFNLIIIITEICKSFSEIIWLHVITSMMGKRRPASVIMVLRLIFSFSSTELNNSFLSYHKQYHDFLYHYCCHGCLTFVSRNYFLQLPTAVSPDLKNISVHLISFLHQRYDHTTVIHILCY